MHTNVFLLIGLLGGFGYLLGKIFMRFGLTSILGFLLIGVILGPLLHFQVPSGFGEIITGLTLSLVGYTVGTSFSLDFLKEMGKKMVIILVVEVIITFIVVFLFVYLLTKNLALSIMLASLSTPTAPAGTIAVLRDWKSKGSLTNMLIAIVGLDDGAGILMFTFGVALTKGILGIHGELLLSILKSLWEIFGAIGLGFIFGFLFSYMVKKIQFSEDGIFSLSLAIPFLVWGIAQEIKVSPILSCMIVGATLINLNKEKGIQTSKILDNVMTPFFILFFGSVGMKIRITGLTKVGLISLLYCIGRTVGKWLGGYCGGSIAKVEEKIKKYLGPGLFNQAGVAVGLAYLTFHEFPGFQSFCETILVSIAITTAIFQFFGPLGVQFAIKKAGEVTQLSEK
ncbi:cation:proton antiporter [bacterium]|nr:cation:proton antiporter [bacterium]